MRPLIHLSIAAMAVATGAALADCPADANEPEPVALGIMRLQPGLDATGATAWSRAIRREANARQLDPLIVVALVMRESSFHPDVAEGRRRGRLGEVGALQVMPGGYAMRFAPPDCRDQTDARCSIATGCAYLAHLRDHACPGSTWRWVAAYRWRTCPSEDAARRDRGALRLRELYERAGGRSWR